MEASRGRWSGTCDEGRDLRKKSSSKRNFCWLLFCLGLLPVERVRNLYCFWKKEEKIELGTNKFRWFDLGKVDDFISSVQKFSIADQTFSRNLRAQICWTWGFNSNMFDQLVSQTVLKNKTENSLRICFIENPFVS